MSEVNNSKRRDQFCKEAIDIITGDRECDYGSPENSFPKIARLWGVYLGHDISEVDVANMMALMKIARISNRVFKSDSYVDAIGYLAIAAELESRRGDI